MNSLAHHVRAKVGAKADPRWDRHKDATAIEIPVSSKLKFSFTVRAIA
jgi:hypothetical protein